MKIHTHLQVAEFGAIAKAKVTMVRKSPFGGAFYIQWKAPIGNAGGRSRHHHHRG
ncbi:MAG: hypothetical protein IPL08_18045 [Saprospiraceae bacterium]|nr:hypothetical protein [Saprospiraceae bacterium]